VPASVVWMNLIVIIKFEIYWFALIICLLGCFLAINYKKLRIEVMIVIILIITSTFLIFSRFDSLTNQKIQVLIDERSELEIVAELKSDLMLRTNKNPFTKQDKWEVVAKTSRVSTKENTWHVEIPIVLIFSNQPTDIEFGTKIQVMGRVSTSYRPDRAFVLQVSRYQKLAGANKFYENINIFRENFSAKARSINHSAAGLIPGLVSGDTRLQSDEFTEAMRKCGLTHLTAVSGGNIAILLAVFIWFFQVLRFRRKSIFFLSVILLIIFLILVRFEPSAMRATVMGVIGIWALTYGGPRTSFGALNFSILFLLLIDPFLSINWGFILSVAATAGLILLAPQFQKIWVSHLPRTPKLFVLLVTLTFSAQLVTYPILGFMVGEISLISLLANTLAMPTVAWVTIFGFLTLIFATLYAPFASLFIYVALPAAIWIEWVAETFEKVPFAQVTFSPLIFFAVILVITIGVLWKLNPHNKIRDLRER
jgi:ComEC/Rec2-related protein